MRASAVGIRSVSIWERYVTGPGLTLTLAAALVLAVTYPIQDANWVTGLAPLTVVGLLAVALSTYLAQSDMPAWKGHLWALGVGYLVIVIVGSAMMPSRPELLRVLELWEEFFHWLSAVRTDEVRSGVVEFGMFLTAITWLLGHLAAWMAIRRRQAWVAVGVGGASLTIALSNATGDSARSLALFMVAAILMLIHMATAQRMFGWRAKHLVFEPRTIFSQSAIILIAGVLIILSVSRIPAPGVAPLSFIAVGLNDTVQSASDTFSRLFNGLPSRRHINTIVFDGPTEFRGNPNLTDDLLFTVTGDAPAYWRARTYTNYASSGWDSVEADWTGFTESGTEDLAREKLTHEYSVAAATDTLFHAGLPAEFDQPIESLTFENAPDDGLQVRFTEGREFFPTRTNLRYTSSGSISNATPRQLRGAGTDYSAELLRRYTQIPDTLPDRVVELARGLTSSFDTPYDKAVSVRDFVRSYQYNLDIPGLPVGADGVDYFLFDLHQGYCDYYASSLAVMLRSQGIPARYVLGYAPGFWNNDLRGYDVLQLNYHSWVEVYFPDYGWVRFEATPPEGIEFGGIQNPAVPLSSDDLDLDFGDGPFPEDDDDGGVVSGDFDATNNAFFLTIGRMFVGLLGAGSLFLLILYYRWWWRLGRLARVDELYAKMSRLATLLGLPASPAQTPAEYAEVLASEVPEHAKAIRSLARLYATRRYAGKPIPMPELRNAEIAWSSIRWAFFRRLFQVKPA
jgi:transglutaminase-like putative cysteine protease